MLLNKKANTGGGSGSAMTPRRNRRRTASNVSREHNIYVMTKVDILTGADAPTELPMEYHKLLWMSKESNKKCVLFPMNLITTYNSIVEPDEILTKISALIKHFTEISKIRRKTRSVWETDRLGFNGNFEMMMNHTDYDLRVANILLMKNIFSCHLRRQCVIYSL